MNILPRVRFATGCAFVFAGLALAPAAKAETCFTAFSGSIHYQFAISLADLKAPGAKSFAGRTFGSLASCAGLNQWPLTATAISRKNQIILSFRAMTVGEPDCGAVDYIINLNPNTLSGPLDLHNDRANFSNSSTLVSAPCGSPKVAVDDPRESNRTDAQGNRAPLE